MKKKQDQKPETEAVEETPAPEAAEAPEAAGAPAAEQATPADEAAAALAEAQKKADDYLALAQRVQADFDNYRRRNESARADSYTDGQAGVASAMLPVLDNLERAVAAAEGIEGEAAQALKSGVELTLRQLNDAFKKLDVTPIDRTGEPFDPNLENAVLQGTAEDGAPGTVCQVLQKGYKMGKKVLRAAFVKVVPEE